MKENTAYTLIGILTFIVAFSIFFLPTESSKPLYYINERVRVDSVSSSLKYENLPDKTWAFHTKIGPFYANQEFFKVGDSIDIKIIKIPK